jgi:hypothetical protein
MAGLVVVVVLISSLAVAQWTRPVGSGTWSSTPIQMFTLYGDVNVTNATWAEWFCLRDDCISAWPVGGGTADGNNYTTSIGFNNTGLVYQLNLARTTMANLTAQFTIPSATGDGNNYTIGIGINQTANVTTLNMQRNNDTNLSVTWTSYDKDTWNNTLEMRTACNYTPLNASLYYNYSWYNLMNVPAGFWDGTDLDTDTNAGTLCAGTTTYLDGEGNCDDISGVYWDACADAYACGWVDCAGVPACESDPQVDAIGMAQWCRGDALGAAIDCDVTPVVDTFNTSTQMINAVNASTGYFSNMKNAWANLQGVPAGFADNTDDNTNCSTAYSCAPIVYTGNATWAVNAVNTTALNLQNAYNIKRFNITANSSAFVANNTKIHFGSNGGYMWMLYNSTTGALEIG